MAKLGGGLSKKPHNFYGVGQGKPHTGAGSINYKPKPYKPKPSKASRKPRPQVVDVYGSGGGSGGSGGYGRSGGGYSRGGGGGGSSSYDRQMALEESRFAWEKQQAEAAKKEEAARRYAGKVANRASYENHLAMINAAIRNAKSRYEADVNMWDQRGRQAKADVRGIYGGAIDATMAGNQATTGAIAAHAGAAEDAGQSVIDAIAGRNEQTVEGLQGNLDAMGLGQGLQQDVVGVSEALALAEMQARSDQANTGANFGLQQGAQQAIGNWNVTGFRGDQATAINDISTSARDRVFELQRVLQGLLQEQEQERLRALGEYEARKAELSY